MFLSKMDGYMCMCYNVTWEWSPADWAIICNTFTNKKNHTNELPTSRGYLSLDYIFFNKHSIIKRKLIAEVVNWICILILSYFVEFLSYNKIIHFTCKNLLTIQLRKIFITKAILCPMLMMWCSLWTHLKEIFTIIHFFLRLISCMDMIHRNFCLLETDY